MNNIISFNNFIIKENNEKNYLLFGELVSINNIKQWGAEIYVEYIKSDGKTYHYIGDDKDFIEDFIETNEILDINPKIEDNIPKILKKYNLVYYIGNKKIETILKDINATKAYSLKNTYSKYPKYRNGKIIVEEI